MFDDISISDTDLTSIYHDASSLKYDGQDDLSDEIEEAKRKIYRQVRDIEQAKHPSYTPAELTTLMETIEDISPDYPLKAKIVYQCLADLMLTRGLVDLYREYQVRADHMPAQYAISSEIEEYKPRTLGR